MKTLKEAVADLRVCQRNQNVDGSVAGIWSMELFFCWSLNQGQQHVTIDGIVIFYKLVRPFTSKTYCHNSQLYWKSLQKKNNIEWIVRLIMGSSGTKIQSLWLYRETFLQSHCIAPVTLFQFCEKRELFTSFFFFFFTYLYHQS